MILIADGGSTKTDWVALNKNKLEVFRIKTLGLNPSVISKEELLSRILNTIELNSIRESIDEIHFYGAGCGSLKANSILTNILQSIFINAVINVSEDMLAAVYASSNNKPAIVCILGTGSNSCYYNGYKTQTITPSLGYTIMDEASGNYFGKILLNSYFYKKMPDKIAKSFETNFNLDVDYIKMNLYRKPNPNMYLAAFSKFMFLHKDEKFIKKIIKKGFQEFFKYRILPYKKGKDTPIYFIGSIAFNFREILEKVALKNNLYITNVIQRPIDNLVEYHKKLI